MKNFLKRRLGLAATGLLIGVAFVWTRRGNMIEAAGAACIVYAASLVSTPLGWLLAGVSLILKAASIDWRSK